MPVKSVPAKSYARQEPMPEESLCPQGALFARKELMPVESLCPQGASFARKDLMPVKTRAPVNPPLFPGGDLSRTWASQAVDASAEEDAAEVDQEANEAAQERDEAVGTRGADVPGARADSCATIHRNRGP